MDYVKITAAALTVAAFIAVPRQPAEAHANRANEASGAIPPLVVAALQHAATARVYRIDDVATGASTGSYQHQIIARQGHTAETYLWTTRLPGLDAHAAGAPSDESIFTLPQTCNRPTPRDQWSCQSESGAVPTLADNLKALLPGRWTSLGVRMVAGQRCHGYGARLPLAGVKTTVHLSVWINPATGFPVAEKADLPSSSAPGGSDTQDGLFSGWNDTKLFALLPSVPGLTSGVPRR